MAGSGFFLGGLAEGAQTAAKQALAERSLSEQTGIAHRGLAIKEATETRAGEQQFLDQGNKIFSDYMGQINEMVKGAVAAGTPPEVLMPQIEPLVETAERFGGLIGRPPGAVRQTIQGMFSQPSTIKAAEIAAKAKAHGTVTEQTAIAGAEKGIPITSGPAVAAPAGPTGVPVVEKFDATLSHHPFPDMKTKIAEAGKLADDYRAATKKHDDTGGHFNTIKAAFADTSGAADFAIVQTFNKLLDPPSVSSPGEQRAIKDASGLADRVRLEWERAVNNKTNVLTVQTKKDVMRVSKLIFDEVEKDRKGKDEFYAHRAKSMKINPKSVIPGYAGPSTDFPKTTANDPLGIR